MAVCYVQLVAPVLNPGPSRLTLLTGETLPLNDDGKLKVNHDSSFTNLEWHAASKQHISMPPADLEQSVWTKTIPATFKQELRRVLLHTYGPSVKDFDVPAYRICW
jgi:hypothetical protein